MKRFLIAVTLALLSHVGFSELQVEWLDADTIVVSGYGYGGGVTNETDLGSCTNCLAISPEEMRAIKSALISLIDDDISLSENIHNSAYSAVEEVIYLKDDIRTFQRCGNAPVSYSSSDLVACTNYIYTVDNSQTSLVKNILPSSALSGVVPHRVVSYNNGIYDYAFQYVYPSLSTIASHLDSILFTNDVLRSNLFNLRTQVSDITEESCRCSGDGGTNSNNSCSSSSCPCKEQWDALLEYVRHIDDDQHMRYIQLDGISNNVWNIDSQFDSYAKLVSGVLYNDATIVVDDGDNSWTNVYRRGYSDLYDYDKSNILQRIELLLYGLSVSSPTNWGDVGDIESGVDSVSSLDDDTDVESVKDTINDQLDGIGDHFEAMFDALNFFGSGSLNDFSLNDPFDVFGLYEFEVESNGANELADFRTLCRTVFQIIYWCGGIAFLVFFWYVVIAFVVRHILFFIKFFNNLLT